MSDQDLPIEGKDVAVQQLLDGVPQKVIDKVVNFSVTAKYDTIDTKPIGTNEVLIDKQPIGWEGELEVAVSTGQLEDFITAYNVSKRNRIPVVVNIVEVLRYRDSTSRTWVYPGVQVEFSRQTRRGSAGTVRLPWVTGKERF